MVLTVASDLKAYIFADEMPGDEAITQRDDMHHSIAKLNVENTCHLDHPDLNLPSLPCTVASSGIASRR